MAAVALVADVVVEGGPSMHPVAVETPGQPRDYRPDSLSSLVLVDHHFHRQRPVHTKMVRCPVDSFYFPTFRIAPEQTTTTVVAEVVVEQEV